MGDQDDLCAVGLGGAQGLYQVAGSAGVGDEQHHILLGHQAGSHDLHMTVGGGAELIGDAGNRALSGSFAEKLESRIHKNGLKRSEQYLKKLKEERNAGRHTLFVDAIDKILQYGVTIEQEIFLE